MKQSLFTIVLVMILSPSCNTNKNTINNADIKGTWYLNQWTSCHTLIFNDSTMLADNHIDTIFYLHYSISGDTLLTYTENREQTFKNKIISLNPDSLVIDGILNISGARIYTRKNHLI